ncbi:MAG: VWA domain-containing protein, partial [Vampirovibrionia bacterium]
MKFANTYIIHFLFLTPLLIAFFIFAFKRQKKLLEKFCNNAICQKIIEGYSAPRKVIRYVLLTLIFIILIFTLARPQWGYTWQDINRKGVDIYIALDVSDSMLAKDVDPNRLERAKREIKDFIDILQGDRVGLIVFSGSSFIQCPLTLDYSAIQLFIDNISTESVPVKGTSIGSAIQTALDAFNRSAESDSKAIILISDGEDHMGNIKKVAEKAKSEDVIIYTIGLGTTSGGKISVNNELKKDMYGNAITTKANFDQLKEIAHITGGKFEYSVTGNMDIEEIYNKGIKKVLKARDLKTTREKNWVDR